MVTFFLLFFLLNSIVTFIPDFIGFICLLLIFSLNKFIIIIRAKQKYQYEYEKILKFTDLIRNQIHELENLNSRKVDKRLPIGSFSFATRACILSSGLILSYQTAGDFTNGIVIGMDFYSKVVLMKKEILYSFQYPIQNKLLSSFGGKSLSFLKLNSIARLINSCKLVILIHLFCHWTSSEFTNTFISTENIFIKITFS